MNSDQSDAEVDRDGAEHILRQIAWAGLVLSVTVVGIFVAFSMGELAVIMTAPALFFYFTLRNSTEIVVRAGS